MLERYSRVQIVTDRYRSDGVPCGTVGIILDVYDNEAYEVEFFDDDGTSITFFSVQRDEVKLVLAT